MLMTGRKLLMSSCLAVCDGNYKSTLVDIGEAGQLSDGGVFGNSNIR